MGKWKAIGVFKKVRENIYGSYKREEKINGFNGYMIGTNKKARSEFNLEKIPFDTLMSVRWMTPWASGFGKNHFSRI